VLVRALGRPCSVFTVAAGPGKTGVFRCHGNAESAAVPSTGQRPHRRVPHSEAGVTDLAKEVNKEQCT